MDIITVSAEKRPELGGTNSSAVRKSGRIPAIVYGGDVNENVSVVLRDVKSLVYTPDFKLAEVDLGGSKHKCILKEVQFHPVTDEILHIDFLKLNEGVPVKVEIPVKFKGVSPGVKEGGELTQTMRKVKVKATPENLVNEIYCDISDLLLGFSVRVRDLEIDEEKLEIMSNPATPVANVAVPRALRSLEMEEEEAAAEAAALAAAEAAEEGAEGEGSEGATE